MSHLKRLAAPEFWPIPKKKYTWVFSPSPGPHKKEECIPLAIVVRDILKLAETGKEAKRIIKAGEVIVDGKVRRLTIDILLVYLMWFLFLSLISTLE